ncbi:hypothetical protein Tco_0393261 [Tanacetum coccineum]
MDGCTKGPQLEEGENLNTRALGTGRTPPRGTSAPAGQAQGGPSPAFVKENIDKKQKGTLLMGPPGQGAEVGLGLLRNIERVSRGRRGPLSPIVRASRRTSSLDLWYDTLSDSGSEDLSIPYRWPKPMPFTSRITCFRYHRRAKLPPNVRVYEGNKDPEDHLSIFSAAAEQEEWHMPVWCKMFRETLSGLARNWFDSLDPKSVDGFEELSNKFLEEFSQ